MTEATRDLTGSWTPALASDFLYGALRRAREHNEVTLFTSDGEDVAVMVPAAKFKALVSVADEARADDEEQRLLAESSFAAGAEVWAEWDGSDQPE